MELLLKISIGYVVAMVTISFIIAAEILLSDRTFQRVFSQVISALLAVFLTVNFIFPNLV